MFGVFLLLESWSFSLVDVALYYVLVFPIYLITIGEFLHMQTKHWYTTEEDFSLFMNLGV